MTMPDHVLEPARMLPVVDRADIVVLGGGSAGLAAAVSAARMGADVILVERYGFLGGVATAAMVTNFCGLYADLGAGARRVVRGFADDLLERIGRQGGLSTPRRVKPGAVAQAFDATAYKFAADDLVTEAGVRLRLHSFGAGVISDGAGIGHLVAESKSGRGAIAASMFVDASGDGDLAALAGCAFDKGDAHGFMQYPTTMFRMRNVEDGAARAARPNIVKAATDAIDSGAFALPRKYVSVSPQPFETEWRANATQLRGEEDAAVDGTDVAQLTWAELEGRRQAREFHRFLKARIPGFEQSSILDTAPQIGIRETRRIKGRLRIESEHVAAGGTCENTVGLGCWPFETHRSGTVEWRSVGGRGYYDIPLEAMLPVDGPGNLIVAGRCVSASAEALASVRVMGSCMAMGQAAGTLAALAIRATIAPGNVGRTQLHDALLRAGACLNAEQQGLISDVSNR